MSTVELFKRRGEREGVGREGERERDRQRERERAVGSGWRRGVVTVLSVGRWE